MPPPPPPPPPPFLDQGSGRGFQAERGVIRDLQAYVNDVAYRARGGVDRQGQRDRQTLRSTIRAMIDSIVATPFTITVPGTHEPRPVFPRADGKRRHRTPHGRRFSNQGILLSLARMRKPFIKREGDDLVPDFAMLRRAKADLTLEFENATEIPLLLDLEQAMSVSVNDTVTGRLEGTRNDVRIKSNTYRYDKWKREHGLDSRTGNATGDLRRDIKAYLRLSWKRRR